MADDETPAEDAGNAPARQIWSLGVALSAALYLTVSLMYVSTYSAEYYNRHAFLTTYRHGIYRYRVLGTELVILTSSFVHRLGIRIGTFATPALATSGSWDLFTAIVIVNGVAFMAYSVMLYLATARRAGWALPYVILITLTVASMYVIDPWDCLVHLCMVSSVVIALQCRKWSWSVCLALSVAGTATHEQFFVAVAAVVAMSITHPAQQLDPSRPWSLRLRRHDRLQRAALAMIIGSFGTYAALRVTLADPSDHQTFWAGASLHFYWSINDHMASAIALLIVALGVISLMVELPRFRRDEAASREWCRRVTAAFWILIIPYLAVSILQGVWFEALRLVLPVVLCQYLIRWAAESDIVHTGVGQPLPTADLRASSLLRVRPIADPIADGA